MDHDRGSLLLAQKVQDKDASDALNYAMDKLRGFGRAKLVRLSVL